MTDLSIDLRRRVVQAYLSGKSGSYNETVALFGIGRASLSRWLRRLRETGDVRPKPRGGNNPRIVDLDWLRRHAEAHPDARLKDRVKDWNASHERPVSLAAMSTAMRAIGWTHKKRRRSPESATAKTSKRNGRPSQ